MEERVVKVDSELLNRIEKFVKENKYEFSSNKQAVNIAILEFLHLRNFEKKGISDDLKNSSTQHSFLNKRGINLSEKRSKNEDN